MVRPIQLVRAWLIRRSPKARYRKPGGYILATVIGLSLILAVGITSVSIRAAAERAGSLQTTTINLSQSAAEIWDRALVCRSQQRTLSVISKQKI